MKVRRYGYSFVVRNNISSRFFPVSSNIRLNALFYLWSIKLSSAHLEIAAKSVVKATDGAGGRLDKFINVEDKLCG